MPKQITEITVDAVGNKTIEYSDGTTGYVPVDIIQRGTDGQPVVVDTEGTPANLPKNISIGPTAPLNPIFRQVWIQTSI
jgi:hypothetical protein